MPPPRGLSPSDFCPNAFRTESGLVSAWAERAFVRPAEMYDGLGDSSCPCWASTPVQYERNHRNRANGSATGAKPVGFPSERL